MLIPFNSRQSVKISPDAKYCIWNLYHINLFAIFTGSARELYIRNDNLAELQAAIDNQEPLKLATFKRCFQPYNSALLTLF